MVLLATSAVVLWLVGNLCTRVWQDFFIFRFSVLPETVQLRFDFPHLDIWLAGEGGGRLNGVYFQQQEARGLVLFFHGNRGNVSRWGQIATQFRHLDYDVLVPDYRGYGRSTGTRSESLFYADAGAWYRWAAERYPPEKIIVYGRSLGSAAATYIASRYSCAQLILETPFSSMRDLFYTYFPFLPPIFFFKYRFDNQQAMRHVVCPMHLFAGRRDFVVPFRCTRRLLPLLKAGDTITLIQEGGHNNLNSFAQYHHQLQGLLGVTTRAPQNP